MQNTEIQASLKLVTQRGNTSKLHYSHDCKLTLCGRRSHAFPLRPASPSVEADCRSCRRAAGLKVIAA